MAGPDSPPITFERNGLLVSMFIAIPGMVFISDIASAPSSSLIFAGSRMSVALGESFTISVELFTTSRTLLTRLRSMLMSAQNSIPP